eukprot:3569244-Pyramimonas_sp.AAC.1
MWARETRQTVRTHIPAIPSTNPLHRVGNNLVVLGCKTGPYTLSAAVISVFGASSTGTRDHARMCSSSASDSEWCGRSSCEESFAEHPVFYGFTEAVFVSQFDMRSRNVLASSVEMQEPGPMHSQAGSCESRGSLS